jgi:hypothetical protein
MMTRQHLATGFLTAAVGFAILRIHVADAIGRPPPVSAASLGWVQPNAARVVGFYDETAQRVLVLSGPSQMTASSRDQVWSWTGTRWEHVMDSGPPARGAVVAAYDLRQRRAVLSGGTARTANDSAYEVVGESWESTPTAWRRMAGAPIEPRDHHAMVYDHDRQSLLLFSGIPANRGAPWPSDTWELRSEGWSRIATGGPPARARAGLVYDTRRKQAVLFGGVGASPARGQPQPFFSDTWVWSLGQWRKVADGGPRGRYAHGMVYDEQRGVVLLYSGAAAHRDAPLSDMWQWDGERWTEIPLTGPTPGFRYQPVMVYDRARGKTVLYGGNIEGKDDTWEWDGTRWALVIP